MKWAASLLVATALVALPDNVGAWDHAGHMLVGQVAWEKTNPPARERVAELVRLLPSQHNQNQPYNFVTVGCWMDDMRAEPGSTRSSIIPLGAMRRPVTRTGPAYAL